MCDKLGAVGTPTFQAMKISRSTVIITSLLLLLVGSNLYWIYAGLDQAVTEKYNEQMLYERLEALAASQKVILNIGADHSREELVSRVSLALSPQSDAFEKDGWVVIGWVQLRFDETGRLVEVGPNLAQE